MQRAFWIFAFIASFLGIFVLLYSFSLDSAPKQGAAAAMAVGLAVIPYCMARAFSFARSLGSDERTTSVFRRETSGEGP